MNLTANQKFRLIQHYPELKTYFELQEKDDKSGADSVLAALMNKIESVKGEKGEKGEKGDKGEPGKLPEREILRFRNQATPKKGIHYHDGRDYVLTDSDKRQIASKVKVPIVDRVIERIETIKEVSKAIDVSSVKGAVSKKDIEDLNKKVLSGMQLVDGRIRAIDMRWRGGGGLSSVSHDSTLTGLGTPSSPLSVVGGSAVPQQPIGSLGQGTFTWTTAPNIIFIDHIPYVKISSDGTVNWTGTTTTVLQNAYPINDIFAL